MSPSWDTWERASGRELHGHRTLLSDNTATKRQQNWLADQFGCTGIGRTLGACVLAWRQLLCYTVHRPIGKGFACPASSRPVNVCISLGSRTPRYRGASVEMYRQEDAHRRASCRHGDRSDYCTTLEGDECCSCWDAYFELNKLEQELPKEEIASMVKESQADPRYLISSIHHRSESRKKMAEKARSSVPSSSLGQTTKPRPFPIPDGLPKTQEEIDEEEEALMPESPYTRLLRRMGRYPDWYTPRPDHETD